MIAVSDSRIPDSFDLLALASRTHVMFIARFVRFHVYYHEIIDNVTLGGFCRKTIWFSHLLAVGIKFVKKTDLLM